MRRRPASPASRTSDLVAPTPETADVTDAAPEPTSVTTYLFATDAGAPRRRRAPDVWRFLVAGVLLLLLGWAARDETPIDARVVEFFDSTPGWIRTLSWIAYSGAALAALGLVLATLLRGGVKRGVLRDIIVRAHHRYGGGDARSAAVDGHVAAVPARVLRRGRAPGLPDRSGRNGRHDRLGDGPVLHLPDSQVRVVGDRRHRGVALPPRPRHVDERAGRLGARRVQRGVGAPDLRLTGGVAACRAPGRPPWSGSESPRPTWPTCPTSRAPSVSRPRPATTAER